MSAFENLCECLVIYSFSFHYRFIRHRHLWSAMDKRSPNFTSSEVEYLVSAVKKWRHIIECKRSDHTSTEDKVKAWKEIEREFNCKYTHTFRSQKVLRTKYGNLKSVSKQKFAADKRATYATGGGCAKPKTATTIDESILEICQVGQVLGNKSLFDGDADDDCGKAEVMEDDCGKVDFDCNSNAF